MKQILQNLKTCTMELAELPCPQVGQGQVLIQTRISLISAGTERSLVEFGKSSWLGKARSQPDKVKLVLDKIKTDGLIPTAQIIFNKLDQPMALGYCNAGVVVDVGTNVTEFKPGDRVASNGPHAEFVCVPKNLCARIPDEVTDDQAVFTILSSVALQGIRLISPSLGEKFVVIGLGLVGLLSVQLLQASGCEVLGIDIKPDRLKLAERHGARSVLAGDGNSSVVAAEGWTQGKGVDGVLITATAKTSEIVHQAAQMCRKRGRIVLIGTVGLNLRQDDFYAKELTFQVSCAYGPGRYDEEYEKGGRDYPYGFVRWTAQRNFQAVLEAMRTGRLRVEELITHRFPLSAAATAYETICSHPDVLGVVLEYASGNKPTSKIKLLERTAPASGQAVVGVIGAGNFSTVTLMPALSKTDARVAYIADMKGAAAQHLCRKYGAENAVTDYKLILRDPAVNAALIVVRHNLHARLVCEALANGKHVFVEKPLAINVEELSQILSATAQVPNRHLMVGFNRRFSRHTVRIKELLAGHSEPLCMTMTVNAGYLPPEDWSHDPIHGGGRIIGEACHFIDLMVYLADSPVRTVVATMMGGEVAIHEDKMSILLGFENGSVGSVNYFANGDKSYPKEALEVFSDGRVLRLENFRRLYGYRFKRFHRFKTFRQDKGHTAEMAAFVDRVVNGGEPLIPLDQLVNVTLATFAAMTSAKERRTIAVPEEYADVLARTSEVAAPA